MKYYNSIKLTVELLLIIILSVSCKKTKDIVIPDNTVPYYEAVTILQIQSYVNKAYIDISGAEPSVADRDFWVNNLKTNGLDSAARVSFISSLQNGADYVTQFNNVYIAPMFDGIYDSLTAVAIVDELNYFRSLAIANGDSAISQYWAYEASKMVLVSDASYDFHRGVITINEYKKRMANCYAYDQINMGVTNFVISCFENYLKRSPTDQEQSNSETMVNGQSARIFMRDGSSRGDFLNIMTTSAGFYEGLVIDSYLHLLSRMPTSYEMSSLTEALSNGSKSIKDIQRILTATVEYTGF
jgi:hypothetical protein